MPYRKKVYKRKPTVFRKTYKRSKGLVSLIKKVQIRNLEPKFHNVFQDAASVFSTASVHNLTNIAQGSTDTSRNGDKLMLTSIGMRFIVRPSPSQSTNALCRLLLIQWYDTNTPGTGDVLENISTNDRQLISPYHHDNKGKYQVLKDIRLSLPAQNTVSSEKIISFYVKPKRKVLNFEGASTVARQHVFWMFFSDVSVGGNAPTISWYAHTNFRDI